MYKYALHVTDKCFCRTVETIIVFLGIKYKERKSRFASVTVFLFSLHTKYISHD